MEPNGHTETALALRPGPPSSLGAYTPRDINEAMTLAKHYAASKILGAYGTAEQVMLVMATGAELGIPATAALRGLYVVEGRVFMSSDLMVALCLNRPDKCERFDLTEQTEAAAAYTVQRKGGQPLTFRFTLDDAKRAKLGGGTGDGFKADSNWSKYGGTMCRHRAASQAARAVFPDVIMGLYDESERDEIVTPRPAPVAPLRQAEPIDGEIVESDEARIVRLMGAADGIAALNVLRDEGNRIWPASRPAAVKAAYTDAKKRIAAEPKHDADGVVREPGEEG